MFVMKSKYLKSVEYAKSLEEELEYEKIKSRHYYDEAIRIFESSKAKEPQFSEDDLRRLLQLCHPDKHNGKQMAIDMTIKIQKLRK